MGFSRRRYWCFILLLTFWSSFTLLLLKTDSLYPVSCPKSPNSNQTHLRIQPSIRTAQVNNVRSLSATALDPAIAFHLASNAPFYATPTRDSDGQTESSKPSLPLAEERVVWIGGQGRSGTTLVRAMLDAHPALNCGPETFILPELIGRYKELLEALRRVGKYCTVK